MIHLKKWTQRTMAGPRYVDTIAIKVNLWKQWTLINNFNNRDNSPISKYNTLITV